MEKLLLGPLSYSHTFNEDFLQHYLYTVRIMYPKRMKTKFFGCKLDSSILSLICRT